NEAREERVTVARVGGELRVELRGEEPGVVRQRDELHEAIARETRGYESGALELLERATVERGAVAMPFGDLVGAVDRFRERPVLDEARPSAEAHGAAEVGRGATRLDRAVPILPFRDERDDGMRRLLVELRGVGVGEPHDVASELDHRHL